VEDALIKSGQFRLPGKRQLVRGFGKPIVVVLDVTETPIERQSHQRCFYSGKKKQHTSNANW